MAGKRLNEAGHPLDAWRRARGMTLEELAHEFGVTASMVSQIIHRRKYPSRTLACRIREVTAIPICRLYDLPDGNGESRCG